MTKPCFCDSGCCSQCAPEGSCPCGCGSIKKHEAHYIDPYEGERPFMISCDEFFQKVWAGEK